MTDYTLVRSRRRTLSMELKRDGTVVVHAPLRLGVEKIDAFVAAQSCNSRNSLCFSWRLMQYPDEAIDLVVVHELCHIAHHDHGPGFYALLGSILPDHRERMKLLRG